MKPTNRSDSEISNQPRKERFLQLFNPHHDRLCRFARAMTHDAEAARELVAETVLAALEGFERLRDDKAFLSYLFTIATRIYQRRRRHRKWFGEYDQERAENIRDTADSPDRAADIEALYHALARLPEKQREAVVLFEISGFSLEEIRELQGGTLSGVKARLRRGRMMLAEILGGDADGVPVRKGSSGREVGHGNHYTIYVEAGSHE